MTALQMRDDAWANSKLIPSWVRGRNVSLDQHNTPSIVSKYCWQSFQKVLKKDKKNVADFKIIEPSAGTGSFFDLLPENNRIGIDIEKFDGYHKKYIQADFLTWNPFRKDHKYIAIGNPPFGYRGWLALSFLNHAAEFCEYVGFILPMSFQSDGKGSPKHRVKGMTLIHHEILPDSLFITDDGGTTNVNTLWQIWKKGGQQMQAPDLSLCDEYIELFTVDQRKERLCGAEKMKDCKIFLQRTFYTNPPSLVNDFSKVKYCCGYGFIIKKDKQKIKELLKNADWVKYSNLATHNCRHISMYHIKQYLLDTYITKIDAQT
jgi:hypothetical protein